jgi:threonyl-tRNA synthetase
MLIIGEREQTNRTVAIRSREEGDLGSMDLSAAVEKLVAESNLDF